jgi:hypothetical protein
VYYGLPAAALWQAHAIMQLTGVHLWLVTVVGLLSGSTLVEVFIIDILYSYEVVRRIAATH